VVADIGPTAQRQPAIPKPLDNAGAASAQLW